MPALLGLAVKALCASSQGGVRAQRLATPLPHLPGAAHTATGAQLALASRVVAVVGWR